MPALPQYLIEGMGRLATGRQLVVLRRLIGLTGKNLTLKSDLSYLDAKSAIRLMKCDVYAGSRFHALHTEWKHRMWLTPSCEENTRMNQVYEGITRLFKEEDPWRF